MYNRAKVEQMLEDSKTDKLMNELTEFHLECIMRSHAKLWHKYDLLMSKYKRDQARINSAIVALEGAEDK
jgi:hypothetical protein